MPQFSDLPMEVLTQIMCECEDIKSLLRLSSTCSKMQQIWHDNATSIACAIFTFTRSEMREFLELAELEEPGNEQSGPAPTRDAHTNTLVRRHPSWLEHSASAISAIRNHYKSFVIAKYGEPSLSMHGPNSKRPDYHREFLTLRRLVTGFDHVSTLAAAFARVRAMSDQQADDTYTIGKALEDYIRLQGSCFGIEKQEDSQAYWESDGMPSDNYLPLNWAFAVYSLYMMSWRPDDTSPCRARSEMSVDLEYTAAREYFGRERMVLMFGEDEPPYVEERRAARENLRREHGDEAEIHSL